MARARVGSRGWGLGGKKARVPPTPHTPPPTSNHLGVRPRWRAAFLLGLALVVFLPMVGARDIVTSHEARVAQTARQMAAVGWPWAARAVSVPVVAIREVDGMKRLAPLPGAGTMEVNPWLVPVINGQGRLQKAQLLYW